MAVSDIRSLAGIIVPVITPIDGQEKVDGRHVRQISTFLIEGGVDAFFVLGTTGEFAYFDREQKRRIVEEFAKSAAGKVPLLVNISEEGTSKTLSFSKTLRGLPVDGFVVTAPYYFRVEKPAEMYKHFATLADALEKPVFMYNMPRLTGNPIPVDVVQKCARHPNVVGMKDSSSDINYFRAVLTATEGEEFGLFQGDERQLLYSLMLGAHGGVNTLANIAPRLAKAIHTAWKSKDYEAAIASQKRYFDLHGIYAAGNAVIPVVKTALSLKGLCDGRCCSPLIAPNETETQNVRDFLLKQGLLDAQ